MTSTFQFTARVAPEAISKVTRLFNASLDDILSCCKTRAKWQRKGSNRCQ